MRRGQFYVIDAFFAAVILFAGIGFLVSDFFSAPNQLAPQVLSQDIENILFDQKIGEISNSYISNNYLILDETLTPMEQVHIWIYNDSQGCNWCEANATLLMTAIMQSFVPQQFGLSITLLNTTNPAFNHSIYNQSTNRNSDFMIVNKRSVITEVNETLKIKDLLEVRLWR